MNGKNHREPSPELLNETWRKNNQAWARMFSRPRARHKGVGAGGELSWVYFGFIGEIYLKKNITAYKNSIKSQFPLIQWES